MYLSRFYLYVVDYLSATPTLGLLFFIHTLSLSFSSRIWTKCPLQLNKYDRHNFIFIYEFYKHFKYFLIWNGKTASNKILFHPIRMVWSIRMLFVKLKPCANAIIDHCIVVNITPFLFIVDIHVRGEETMHRSSSLWSKVTPLCAGGQCRKFSELVIRVEFYTFSVALTRTLHPFPFELESKHERVSVFDIIPNRDTLSGCERAYLAIVTVHSMNY